MAGVVSVDMPEFIGHGRRRPTEDHRRPASTRPFVTQPPVGLAKAGLLDLPGTLGADTELVAELGQREVGPLEAEAAAGDRASVNVVRGVATAVTG